MAKKGFSAGFVAGFTTSELVHKLVKEIKETLENLKIPVEENIIKQSESGVNYVETAQLDPTVEVTPEVDEFLRKAV